MTHLIAIAVEPYTSQELADFEQLIFASANADHKVRLTARAFLASFVNEHGQAKCDLMMEKLSSWHDKPPGQDS